MEHRLIIPTEARELIYHLHRVLYGLNELILAQINRNGHLTSKVTQILFFLTTKFCSGLFVGIVNRRNMSDSYWCWKLSHRRVYVPYNKYLLLNLCMLMIFSFKNLLRYDWYMTYNNLYILNVFNLMSLEMMAIYIGKSITTLYATNIFITSKTFLLPSLFIN